MLALQSEGVTVADECPNDIAVGIEVILGSDYIPLIHKNLSVRKGVHLLDTPAGAVIISQLPDWATENEEHQDKTIMEPIVA